MENNIFESIKKINEYGQEYWSARELFKILEYSEYGKFLPAINRAKESCKSSKESVEDHFAHVSEMVEIGSGAKREIENIYLITDSMQAEFIKRNNFNNYTEPRLLDAHAVAGARLTLGTF